MKPTVYIAGKPLLPQGVNILYHLYHNVTVELKDSLAKWRHKSIACCLFGKHQGAKKSSFKSRKSFLKDA